VQLTRLSIVPLSARNAVVHLPRLTGKTGAPIRGASGQLNERTSKSIVPLSARNVVVSVSDLDVGARAASLPLLRRESQRKRQHALLVLPPRRAQYRIVRRTVESH
jgi:hypothetical protein